MNLAKSALLLVDLRTSRLDPCRGVEVGGGGILTLSGHRSLISRNLFVKKEYCALICNPISVLWKLIRRLP